MSYDPTNPDPAYRDFGFEAGDLAIFHPKHGESSIPNWPHQEFHLNKDKYEGSIVVILHRGTGCFFTIKTGDKSIFYAHPDELEPYLK